MFIKNKIILSWPYVLIKSNMPLQEQEAGSRERKQETGITR